jgi:flavin reductase (DIM6/NTAB) family NADH-FMN oxidoreductase RutF
MTTAEDLLTRVDSPLWLVSAEAGGRRGGLIATFVCSASLVPEAPRVIVGLAKHHHTWSLIEASGSFVLHLLSAGNLDWVWRFGLSSGRDFDKLAGLTLCATACGTPRVTGAIGWLACRVEANLDTGDRTLYLGAVVESGLDRDDRPLTVLAMLAQASPAQLAELKRQREADAGLDAAALAAWRASRPPRT